jgi:tRNA threonylcarbamoyladenosine biosynthesis protein TsaB
VNLLALDTSTEACSAALQRADGQVFTRFEIAPRRHNLLLPEMMGSVLEEAGIARTELTHCAFANGPGAFTGIRIAAAQAQGIGMGLNIPLVTVSTLAVLAQAGLDAADADTALVALDARMNEIYWAVYRRDAEGLARLRDSERLDPLDSVRIDDDIECGVGHGWLEPLRESVDFPVDSDLLPSAAAMLPLARDAVAAGRLVQAEQASINYLRMRVAEKPASR